MGFVPHKNIIKLFSEAKALLFPSLWYEGFPLTIVESFSVGTPVIGSDIGNIRELIEDGETGFKFAAGDKGDLVRVIRCFDDNIFDPQKIKDNCMNKYYESKNYGSLSEIYQYVMTKTM